MNVSKRIFNNEECIIELGYTLVVMYSILHDFAYYITFKRALKNYATDYSDSEEQPIEDFEFFADVNDPVVQHCYETHHIVTSLFLDLNRSAMLKEEDIDYESFDDHQFTFLPSFRFGFKRKSYGLMLFHYERYFESCISALFNFACAFTLHSYKVPFTLKAKVSYTSADCLWFLDDQQPVVQMLSEAIRKLQSSAGMLYTATEGKKRSPKY